MARFHITTADGELHTGRVQGSGGCLQGPSGLATLRRASNGLPVNVYDPESKPPFVSGPEKITHIAVYGHSADSTYKSVPILGATIEEASLVDEEASSAPTPEAKCDVESSAGTAVKADAGKVRVDLLPTGPLLEVAAVFTFGAKKYAPYNYLQGDGLPNSRIYAACLRHVWAWWGGEPSDPESGHSHLAHAVCCLLMLMHIQQEGSGANDDRPARGQREARMREKQWL